MVERLTHTFDTPTPGAKRDGKKGKGKANWRRKPCIANIIGVKEPIEFSSRTEAGEHFGITKAAVVYNITQNLQSNKITTPQSKKVTTEVAMLYFPINLLMNPF